MKNWRIGRWTSCFALIGAFTPVLRVLADDGQAASVRLTPDDPAALARFGEAIAIDGDSALIGATGDDANGVLAGAVYAFRRGPSGIWTEEQKLIPIDGAANELFGFSVDLLSDLAIVGAFRDDENGPASGSAYVFRREPGGTWIQEAKIVPIDGSTQDRFGFSVSIGVGFEGIIACIGSYLDDTTGLDSGSAYIFERDINGNWTESEKIVGNDTEALDSFGWSVDIDGSTAMIGAYLDDDLGGGSGAAYFFRRDLLGEWSQLQKITASDGTAVDNFGIDVAIDEPLAVVGAYLDDDNGSESGSAYVFRFSQGVWVEDAKLIAPDGQPNDEFGRHVAIQGNRVVIGSSLNDEAGSDTGAAYVFEFDGDDWLFRNKLGALTPENFAEFGHAVAIDGLDVMVGAWRETNSAMDGAGAAYHYDLSQIGCPGDLNSDGEVNTSDLGILIGAFGSANQVADLNGDGVVDTSDLGLLIASFGATCG